jgi:uncharacterized protein YkwD
VGFDARPSRDPESQPLAYLWDFGNGTTTVGPTGVTTYEEPGTFTARVTVTDSTGLSAVSQVVVVVGTPFSVETFAHQVVHLTNIQRKSQGVPPLRENEALDEASFSHAYDMSSNHYFAHDSPTGVTPWKRMHDAGYTFATAGENIAAGYATAATVVDGWMKSPDHRANILNPTFRELGAAYSLSLHDPLGYAKYWVQGFGARTDVFPVVIEDEAFSTSSRDVTLYVYGVGWAETMMVSEDPGFAGADWQPYATSVPWKLSAGPGLKTVRVRLRNGAGVVQVSEDEIVLK